MLNEQTLAALDKFWRDKLQKRRPVKRGRKQPQETGHICGKCGRERDLAFDFCRGCGSEKVVQIILKGGPASRQQAKSLVGGRQTARSSRSKSSRKLT